jgi:hypothetical protein
MITKSGLAPLTLCGADKPYLKIGPEHFFPTTICQLLLTPAYPF